MKNKPNQRSQLIGRSAPKRCFETLNVIIMNKKLMHRTAPVSLPLIGSLICILTLSTATGFTDILENIGRTGRFGMRGLFQITIISGVVIAILDWATPLKNKLLSTVFYLCSAGSIALGWIFAQSIIHF